MVSYSWVCQLLRCLLDSPLNSFFPLCPFPRASHFELSSLNMDLSRQCPSSCALLRTYLDTLSLFQSSHLRFLLVILIIV